MPVWSLAAVADDNRLCRLNVERFEMPQILKRLTRSSRQLAELKGIAASIPNQDKPYEITSFTN
ncbi:MAG: hypothetical protein HQL89_01315 [Magnetococcales bacterium]|nr:hypothetical protein [Magnetococcales bacterium]